MKEKVFVFVLFVGFVFSVFGQNESDFRYTEYNGSIFITGYTGSVKNVRIPDRINGLPVTVIGPAVFYEYENGDFENGTGKGLTSVTIPNSVTYIGDYAFADNQLTSVTLPNSLAYIGESAFYNNQLTSVTIPNSVTSIGDYVFCKNRLTSVIIPNSVTTIEGYAFRNNQLTSVTIPNSVTTIGEAAFAGNQLTSVTIPNSVTSIEQSAFVDNTSLRSITFAENSRLETIGGYAFEGCISLTSITIPASVTSIGASAFARVYNGNPMSLTTLTFAPGSRLQTIGKRAFEGNKLTNVVIPNRVTEIGEWAFYDNPLVSVTIPESVRKIGDVAFKTGNSGSAGFSLATVIIGSNVDFGRSYHDPFPGNFKQAYIDTNRRRGGRYVVLRNGGKTSSGQIVDFWQYAGSQ